MGMFAGAYLYVTVFAPEYQSDITTLEAIGSDAVVINAQIYGGCQRNDLCASFRLIDDRSYSYLPYPEAEIEQGTLPSEISKAIFTLIASSDFFDDTLAVRRDFCDSFVDGVDYLYEVTLDDEVYMLDTCTTSFRDDLVLQSALRTAWEFMENPKATYPPILEKGIGDFFKERFQGTAN